MTEQVDHVKEMELRRSFFAVLAGFLALFAIVAIIWVLRGLLSPVLVGLLFAYIANPVVNWTERCWRWPRLVTVLLVVVMIMAIILAAAVWLAPLAITQISQLFEMLPDYIDRLSRVLHTGGGLSEEVRERLSEAAENPERLVPVLLSGAARGVGIFATALGRLTYVGIYITLLVVFFIAFSVRLPQIKAWCRQFLPHSHREEVLTTVQKISDAAGVFLRARLIIAGIVGVLLSVGWAFADVPYWFVFAMATAVLNIVPYASVVGWLAVLLINGLSVDSLGEVFYALLWPTVVYTVVQFLDGWVLSPWLEGGLLRIHPVVVLFAVLAGGAVAGVLGMLMAIPLVAAWQICFTDVIKPRLIDWAGEH